MEIQDLLKELNKRDVRLTLEGKNLNVSAPNGSINNSLRDALKKHKRDIIRLLKASKSNQSFPKLKKVRRSEFPALSITQEGIWFIDKYAKGLDTRYNMHWSYRLKGCLNVDALRYAFNELVSRHESLRTTFPEIEGKGYQRVEEEQILDIPLIEVREAWIQQYLEDQAKFVFDLSRGPLLKVSVLRVNTNDHVLLVCMHHIISDAWSINIINREISALYTAKIKGSDYPLDAIGLQYIDYSEWQRGYIQHKFVEDEKTYWKQKLKDTPELLDLPTDKPRPKEQSFSGAIEKFSICEKLAGQLKALGKRHGVTLSSILYTAFSCLLYRFTGQKDFCFGTPFAGRQDKDLEHLIGFFVNTSVLRVSINPDKSFNYLLRKISGQLITDQDNQNLPFEQIVEIVNPKRSASYSPIFQVMIAIGKGDDSILELGDIRAPIIWTDAATAKFDLLLDLAELDKTIEGRLEYATSLFEVRSIKQLIEHFLLILNEICRDPDQSVGGFSLLSKSEENMILTERNSTKNFYSSEVGIHKLFEERVSKDPNAIVVVFDDNNYSYDELNQRSNQLARYLVDKYGSDEFRVGLCIEPSFDMLVGILGTLKAGGAYVPIDPEYPIARIDKIITDSDISLVLTQGAISRDQFLGREALCLCLDNEWLERCGRNEIHNLDIHINPDRLAYVIYTSGSTGEPKGVMVSHRSSVNHTNWMTKVFNLTSADRVLFKTPLIFDASGWEWMAPLAVGARIVAAKQGGYRDPDYLAAMIHRHEISIVQAVPSLLSMLFQPEYIENIKSLRCIFSGGERLVQSIVQKFYALGISATLCNLYGPTECTIDSTFYLVNRSEDEGDSPIGRPIDNVQVYVLDDDLNPVPDNIRGELYIGGDALARGYSKRADLTAERFIPNPFSNEPGSRLYRSGDVVRYRFDGKLHFVGRIDNQVKLRGLRIELGEIEAALNCVKGVNGAVANVSVLADGIDTLVAYVVLSSDAKLTSENLREDLSKSLPSYMVPTFIIIVEEFPMTQSGKVDRKALPLPNNEIVNDYSQPRTDTEAKLRSIWADVLRIDVDKIGIRSDFFSLGGHSLVATQVASRIRKQFQVEIDLSKIFSANSLEGLSASIDQALIDGVRVADPIPITEIDSNKIPLSFAQQRLWFLNKLEEGKDTSYNMAWTLRLEGTLDIYALVNAFRALIQRHESLRTTFHEESNDAVQRIADDIKFDLPLIEVNEASIDRYYEQNAKHLFDLSTGPLIAAKLIKVSSSTYDLLLNIHHIVFDGWSLGVFYRDLSLLYNAFREQRKCNLPPLEIRYRDFSCWQRQWLRGAILQRQLSYWTRQLTDAPELLDLPTDYPRPAVQSYRGRELKVEISKELTYKLQSVAKQEKATLFMVLMAAFKVLLYRYSGVEDMCVGTVVANRNRQDLEGLIGFFVNTLVLRDHVTDSVSFRDLLRQVKQTALSAYANQDIPFEYLVEKINPERSLSYMPLAQVVLVLQNTLQESLELDGLKVSQIESDTYTAKFDMILDLKETDDGVRGRLEFSTDLFEQQSVERLIMHYESLLQAIVEDVTQSVAELPLINRQETAALLSLWNGNYCPDKVSHTIVELFQLQASRTPDASAVSFEGNDISYRDLDARSNRLANYLLSQDVVTESRVGISLDRTLEMIVAILGVLKAGAAYVPIDPDNPKDRIQYILDDSNISFLLTLESIQEKIFDEVPSYCICLDNAWAEINQCSNRNPAVFLSPDNLAYVIYTSGSTGRPKGTLITHANVTRLFRTTEEMFKFNNHDVWTLFHSFAFDFSVWEIWGALFYGGRLVVVPYWVSREPEVFYKLVCDQGVTVLNQTPSAFKQFIAADKLLANGIRDINLRYVIFGGEALDMKSLDPWFESHGDMQPKLINMYGITETTVHVTFYEIRKEDSRGISSVIGKQLPDLQAYILDRKMLPVPVGFPGELYVGGMGVARGYHARPDLTAQRFIPNPFATRDAERLYKSGDLVRYQADGDIEYLGRIDQQVKVRGFRIELGEIKSRIIEHPAIQDSCVIVREDTPEDKKIVAYIVADKGYGPENAGRNSLSENAVSQWQDVFEDNYSDSKAQEPFQDFTGWNESYDGYPILEDQMREWADDAAQSILALKPKNVLEIACGTGLLLGRLVRHCESYVGTDFSPTVLDQLRSKLARLGEHAEKVELVLGSADNLSALSDRKFDTIVLNSVAQYFPDLEYFLEVLRQAKNLLVQGGAIYLGDIRHFGLLEPFHASVQFYKHGSRIRNSEDLRRLARHYAATDNELVIDPKFFCLYKESNLEFSHVQIIPKLGSYNNELSAYRYDVVLHTDKNIEIKPIDGWIDWNKDNYSLTKLKLHLGVVNPEKIAIRGICNSRVAKDINILEFLEPHDPVCESEASIEENASVVTQRGVTTHELKQLAEAQSYDIEISWASADARGSFDAVLYKSDSVTFPVLHAFPEPSVETGDMSYKKLANNPRFQDIKQEILVGLRTYLSEKMPEYMVPSHFVFMEQIPLTVNGKVNVRALPEPDLIVLQERDYVAPESEMERKLVEIWSSVLGLESEKLGTKTSFFELGGDSILSLQVVSRAKQLGIYLTPRQIFEHRTIKELSQVAAAESGIESEQGLVKGQFKLTPIQHWFFEQNLDNYHHYNQAFLLEVPNNLDEVLLRQALNALLEHHDALRQRFKRLDRGEWVADLDGELEVIELDRYNLSHLDSKDKVKGLAQEANSLQTKLNIETGPIIKAAHFQMGEGKSDRLLIVVHHLAIDGVSWRILLEDLETAYEQRKRGDAIELPEKTTSYKSWAEHIIKYAKSNELISELEYWLELSRREIPTVPQDSKIEQEENTIAKAGTLITKLSSRATMKLLHDANAAYNTEINDLLLTALLLAFNEWTRKKALFINLEGHGREEIFKSIDTSRTLGWFTTIYPVVLRLESSTNLAASLMAVKEQLRSLPKRGIGYGVLRFCADTSIATPLRELPAPDLRFNYLGQFDQMTKGSSFFKWAEEEAGSYADRNQIRSALIDFNGVVINQQLEFHITYCTACHEEKTIQRLATNYFEKLEALIDHCTASDQMRYTPSDFPEAELNKDDLDALLSSLEAAHEK